MIELKNVSKSYGEKKILKDICLSIRRGEITFIVGTSGAGKSTLLNMIGGLDNVSSGSILLDGKDVTANPDEYRAEKTGFIFQDFNLISGLTVKENIELAVRLSGNVYDEKTASEEIKKLGIKDADQRVETLSGGEKQRTAIIRSVCKNSDIIIADEPTGNLDSENAELVFDMLSRMKENRHIIVVSHDMEKAQKYGDRIVRIVDGHIVEESAEETGKDTGDEEKTAAVRGEGIEKRVNRTMLKPILMLGKNSIRRRKGRIFSIALVLALAISAIAMVINFRVSSDAMEHDVNVNYLENDWIKLYFESTPNAGYRESVFTDSDIADIKEKYEIKEAAETYCEENMNWLFSVGSNTASVYLKQIELNDFFEERVMSNNIEGKFPNNSDEIIIAEDAAAKLFGEENCIGKTITLNDGNGGSIEAVICGVNHTVNPFDCIYSFADNQKIKEMLEKEIKRTLYERIEVMPFYDKVQSMTTGGIYGTVRTYDGGEKILYGRAPETEKDIIISSELAKYAYTGLGIDEYSGAETDVYNLTETMTDKLFSKKLAINFNGVFAIHICGIYDSEQIEMKFATALIEELEKAEPTGIDIYAKRPEDVSAIKDAINGGEEFTANTQLDNLKENVMLQTRFFGLALVAVGAVLILISVALLSSFSKISVLERRREVATIKSMGAGNGSVLRVLMFDSGIIAVLGFALSLAFYAMLDAALPYVLPDTALQDYGYPLQEIVVINIIFAVLVMLYTGVYLRKLVKKTPAELFAE